MTFYMSVSFLCLQNKIKVYFYTILLNFTHQQKYYWMPDKLVTQHN